ncbi:MAG: ester cyclase [Chloroflexi bacterium]|nr:ester cyclase [Chloroflexota bacterium]
MKRTKLFLIVTLALAVLVTGFQLAAAQDEMTQANKANIIREVDDVFSQGNLDLVDELYAEDFVDHTPNGDTNGRQGIRATVTGLRTAMPDLKVTPELLLADGQWVAGRFKATGTFSGEFALPTGTLPGNNQPIELIIHHIWKFNDDGQIQEGWAQWDNLSFLMQLGAIPMPEAATASEATPEADTAMMPAPEFTIMPLPDDVVVGTVAGVKHVVDEAFNKGNLAAIDERFSPDWMDYSDQQTRDAFKAEIEGLRAAIPDLKASVPIIVAEGNWVMFRFEAEGTFQNDMTLPDGTVVKATGKPIKVAAHILGHTDENGVFTAEWDVFDNLSYATQLGLIPPMQ